ncbi:MAG: hypothetical protein HY858_08225 [Candidatus Solibacter usitatus]|nr:hypothetical protein [Candidatus Solibacter usitatus]
MFGSNVEVEVEVGGGYGRGEEAELAEVAQVVVDDALPEGDEAGGEGKGAGAVGEGFEGVGVVEGRGCAGDLELERPAGAFDFEGFELGGDAGIAGEAPVGVGDIGDDLGFHGGSGLELLDEGLVVGEEGVAVIVGEEDGRSGIEAVLEGVHGGAGLAGGGSGALGLGAVDAGLLGLAVADHVVTPWSGLVAG